MELELKIDGTSGNEQLEYAMAKLFVAAFELFKKKLKSYGTNNISEYGERGVVLRMNDKIKRLKNIVWEGIGNPIEDETVEDTYLDVAVYSCIGIIVREGEWE